MEDKIDRFGLCPNCGTNWKGPEIYQQLSSLSCNSDKSEKELKDLAGKYGWTEHNRTFFSNLISHEMDGKHLLECPKITCGHIFDRYTGEEWRSMFDYKHGYPKVESIKLMGAKLNPNDYIIKETVLNNSEIVDRFEESIHVTTKNRQQIEKELQKKVDNDED